MDLFSLLLVLVVIGVVLSFVPIDPQMRKIINIIVVVCLVVFLFHFLGGSTGHGTLLGRNCGP